MNVGFLSEPSLSLHTQRVRAGYLCLEELVAHWLERDPFRAHEHAMHFYALDAVS